MLDMGQHSAYNGHSLVCQFHQTLRAASGPTAAGMQSDQERRGELAVVSEIKRMPLNAPAADGPLTVTKSTILQLNQLIIV